MILHVDMDAYFATLEQQWNPQLRSKPIIICGKGSGERTVVATASYEAKKLGVKTAMAVWQAKKICPQAILVSAHYQKYVATTKKLIAIFESFTPDVEVFSIDEAFLKIENCELKIAHQIKKRIKKEIGELCTCSIGIAENKLLAKIASEYQKPNGLTIVLNDETLMTNDYSNPKPEALINHFDFKLDSSFIIRHSDLLNSIELTAIPGIGSKVFRRLQRLGITTVQKLLDTDYLILINEFGPSYALTLYNLCRGIDNSPFTRYRDAPDEKSFGHSYTLPKEIYRLDQAKATLLHLAEKVGERMRTKGFFGKTVHIWLRFTDMSGWGKQITLSQPTNDGYTIYKTGENLIHHSPLVIRHSNRIRAVGISCSNLTRTDQLSLFAHNRKKRDTSKLLDNINHKYGKNTLLRAETLSILDIFEDIPDGRDKRKFSTIE